MENNNLKLDMTKYIRKEDDYTSIIDKLERFRAKIIDKFSGIEIDTCVFVVSRQIHIRTPNKVKGVEKKLNSLHLKVLNHCESVYSLGLKRRKVVRLITVCLTT